MVKYEKKINRTDFKDLLFSGSIQVFILQETLKKVFEKKGKEKSFWKKEETIIPDVCFFHV